MMKYQNWEGVNGVLLLQTNSKNKYTYASSSSSSSSPKAAGVWSGDNIIELFIDNNSEYEALALIAYNWMFFRRV